MEVSVPRTVSTPNGLVKVITPEEFDEAVALYRKQKYTVGDDHEPLCSACGDSIRLTHVSHVVLYNEYYGEVPRWEEANERDDTIGYYRSYCPTCEGHPNPIGPPVVAEGSFYSVH